jgi:hypothetical protein
MYRSDAQAPELGSAARVCGRRGTRRYSLSETTRLRRRPACSRPATVINSVSTIPTQLQKWPVDIGKVHLNLLSAL